MNNTITFKELKKQYSGRNECFVEVTDRASAMSDINSVASCCFGAGEEFGDSGWIKLATPSPRSEGDKRTVFVCKKSLVSS